MKVHTSGSLQLSKSVLTIGALDGVHRGHQVLIRKGLNRSQKLGVPLVVYTFDPPPRVYFQHALLLTPLEERLNKLQTSGVDHVVIASFSADYASRGVQTFLEEISEFNPLEIWEGPDFTFG